MFLNHLVMGGRFCFIPPMQTIKFNTFNRFVILGIVRGGEWLWRVENMKDKNNGASVYVHGSSLTAGAQSFVFCSKLWLTILLDNKMKTKGMLTNVVHRQVQKANKNI